MMEMVVRLYELQAEDAFRFLGLQDRYTVVKQTGTRTAFEGKNRKLRVIHCTHAVIKVEK